MKKNVTSYSHCATLMPTFPPPGTPLTFPSPTSFCLQKNTALIPKRAEALIIFEENTLCLLSQHLTLILLVDLCLLWKCGVKVAN